MNISKSTLIVTAIAALLLAGCAKTTESIKYEDDKAYFEAWLSQYHSDAKRIGRGVYIIEEDSSQAQENEPAIEKDGYAYIESVVSDLDGNISEFTDEQTAKLMGKYDKNNYYGPRVVCTVAKSSYAGLIDAIEGMKPGQQRTVVIPKWLMSYKEHSSEEAYLNETVTAEHRIYKITAVRFVKDVTEYQNSLIKEYIQKYIDANGISKEKIDTIAEGLYMVSLRDPIDTNAFKADSTYYINYTGMLLDGTVFDTNDERQAKICGIYSSSRSYGPTAIKNGEKASDITMGGNSVIQGFYSLLYRMRSMQKAFGIFNSTYGYGYDGSGNSIPGYAPLIFEVDMTQKPEN